MHVCAKTHTHAPCVNSEALQDNKALRFKKTTNSKCNANGCTRVLCTYAISKQAHLRSM